MRALNGSENKARDITRTCKNVTMAPCCDTNQVFYFQFSNKNQLSESFWDHS